MHLTLEFAGGAELLFGKQKTHPVDLPESQTPWTIRTLLVWMRDNLLRERPELFIQDGLNYQLKENDNILFVSTLHGG
ncbi:unnamed protein product [Adineta ricciae]|uniref:Ubiquitin-related modifier 1 homolog n=1 Tax=Adineta ricciae TaxID=249248 RepID=A0A814GSS4_ADIRI|nr:unnamed protein product [Adineta ricciae]